MNTISLNMIKYFIYARKSSESEDRQAQSIDDQISLLSTMARERKLTIVDTLSESKSAKAPNKRTMFSAMMGRIHDQEATGIICWSLDRLTRNPVDAGALQWLLQNGTIEEIVTPSKTFTRQDSGIIMSVMAGVGNQFIIDLRKNTRRGLMSKAEKGWLPSGAKAGYMNDKFADKGNKTILVDPVRFPLIKKVWDLMLTGMYSPPQILNKLNNEWAYRTPQHRNLGNKPMSRSAIYTLFTDPFYYGDFEYPVGSGNWHVGKHTKMITRDEFDRVQALLGAKGRIRPKYRQFTYTGLIRCGECGAIITAEEKHQVICTNCKHKFSSVNSKSCPKCNTAIENMKNPTILHYVYYHCTKRKKQLCHQKTIRLDKLESQVNDLLTRIQISDRFKNWAIKHLNEVADLETDDRNAVLASLQSAYENCISRIDNLVKLKISSQNTNGELLSDDEFKDQKNALLKEKSEITARLETIDNRVDNLVELTEKTFNFACYAKHWFDKGDIGTKKQILLGIGSNLTLKDQTLQVDLQKPLNFIELAKTAEASITSMFEHEKRSDLSIQYERTWAQNSTLLPR